MPTQEQLNAAIQAGYSQEQINSYLASKQPKPKSLGGFIGNLGKSAVSNIGSMASALLHPITTVKNIGKTALGAAQLLAPGEQGYEQNARDVGNFYKQRYGGLNNIGETLYNDPFGAALDASAVLGGAGALVKGAGAASKVGGLTRAGQGLSRAASVVDPFSIAGRGISGVTGKATKGLGKALTAESENILTRGMGSPEKLTKVKGLAGVSMDDLFKKYNTYERSPEAFGKGADVAGAKVKSLVAQAGKKGVGVNTSRMVKLFNDEIAKLAKEGQTSDRALTQATELARRRDMFLKAIQEGEATATPLNANVQRVYDIKSSFQGDVPQSTFGMPTQEIGKVGGATIGYRTLLSGIEEAAPGIKQTGREQAALIKLKDMATRAESRGAARQNVNFSKLGGTTAGAVVAGIPGAIGGYALEQVANSPRFLAGASKGLGIAGKGLQTARTPQNVNRAVSSVSNLARAGRMLPPAQPTQRQQPQFRPVRPTVSPAIKSNLPTAEGFYSELRKRRGY